MEEKLGTGAVKDTPDIRDYLYKFLIAGAPQVIWNNEPLGRPEPADTNQFTADCCVGEAWSNLHWIHKGTQYAVRSLFAYIALNYGAEIRAGGLQLINSGQQTLNEIPDPNPKTAINMRSKSGLNPQSALHHREADIFSINANNINDVAMAIRDHKGVSFGILYDSVGWADLNLPTVGTGQGTGHDICGFDYHIHNGEKCIIAKSSWCRVGHHVHHIRERFFNSNNTFSAWVLVPRENNMIKRYLVNKNGKLGVLVSTDGDGVFTDVVFWAKSEAHLAELKNQYEIPPNALVITYPV